ncbi:leukotriene A-4 hydrolase isoform X2 [Tribolium castaneum]
MGAEGLSPRDPSSYSRPEDVAVTNIFLNLTVDFDKKILHGNVDLDVSKINKNATELILDAKDLKISKVIDDNTKQELKFVISQPQEEFGSKLSVELPKQGNDTYKISIFYENSPNASGLQWLTPEQTAGKKHPYLFSQFQAIHARSVLPCQDTPEVKTKYQAAISAPSNLTVLMSAIPSKTEISGAFKRSHFSQDVPMPAYLIAIAVGALESRKIGPRSHVWAEKEIIEDCAYEFAETEHQLKTAEEICGPYVWGIYDLLVLPPSFAFGGMENPCLTFVTPTLLAGDRSLANVVAHEIAHSWTGNLITNRNFEHFWLNEGFTVFVERKIKARLTSPAHQDFDAYCRLSELKEAVKLLGENSPLTKLVVDLKGVHPDDAFSVVPYEKGQTFLRYLEEVVGGPAQFEPFLREYFNTFKYKSIDTNDFKSFFEKYFASKAAIKSVDWNTWLYGTGMPPVVPNYNTSLATNCDKLMKQFVEWDEKAACPVETTHIKNLGADEIIYLLQEIWSGKPLSIPKLEQLDKLFEFSKVKNSEVKFRWLRIGLKAHWMKSVEPTLKWINEVGRMKFVRPLYRDLYAWEEVRSKAIENFKLNKNSMMHVVAYTVSKDLHLTS